ncbi:MAG: hypothetical protein HYX41_07815 [Bdellovibrio sp.]|nr:hypothetical protein [Bdellovibrio sp.]
MKAYLKTLIYLAATLTVITTLSCGLDDRPEQPTRTPEASKPSESPTPPVKKGPLFTVISRTDSEPEQVTTLTRTISKNEDYHSYKVDSPITLASNMSDRLQFEIHALPVHLKTRSKRLNAAVTSEIGK